MKPRFVANEIYHIYNRGVEKRNIFVNDNNRFRFIHDLYEFNDESPALNIYYKFPPGQSYEVQLRKMVEQRKKELRKPLVEILVFCLMENHYHLLMRQNSENGIVRFMQKLGTGYTNYFNTTYERVGPLFQGRFKAVLIEKESHLLHMPFYIHANPLDIIFSGWKEKKFNFEKAIVFLNTYRWSSYLDYAGKKNFPSVIQSEFLVDYFKGNYKKEMHTWLKNIYSENSFESIQEVMLE